MSRRRWLAGTVLSGIGIAALGDEPPKTESELAEEVAPVLAHARKVKLRGFRSSRTPHYVGVGNAPDQFRNGALERCEALAREYQRFFRDPKFGVSLPKERLTVIALKDRKSYETYLGEAAGGDVGGHYDLETNQLVIFDFRGDAIDLAVPSERINMFTLVHEGLHQLSYNTGLFERRADVPVAISEGLAMYGELWQTSNKRASFGVVNKPRLQVLMRQDDDGSPWLPLADLLTNDELFRAQETEQLAYAEAWVLVHYMMSVPKRPKFQAYLQALRDRRTSAERLKDATKFFGDLARLNKDVRQYAFRQVRV